MKFFPKKIVLFALLVFSTVSASAQDPPSPDDEPCVGCEPPPLPINQNVGFLLASGLVLGIVVVYKKDTKKASV